MGKILSDRTADAVLKMLSERRSSYGNYFAGDRSGPRWVIVSCDSATPVSEDEGHWGNQYFPATVILAASDLEYPPEGELTIDIVGLPVLLTLLADGPEWATPKAGGVYAGQLCGEVVADRQNPGTSLEVAGRARVVGPYLSAGSESVFGVGYQTGGSYAIGPDGTWVSPPGVSVALPSAGVYELTVNTDVSAYVTANAVYSAGNEVATVECRLYNVTDGNVVSPYGASLPYEWSAFVLPVVSATNQHSSFSVPIEVTVPSTIKLEGRRLVGPTWFSCQFMVGNGRSSSLRYRKY